MENNFDFWQFYLNKILGQMKQLIKKKKYIYADFHIHSDYSVDSNQTLIQIINKSKKLGLDIISITDHDSISLYDELYEYLNEKEHITPIIIPGIEFTIDNKKYGSQFHILQLMINPKSQSIIKNIEYQEKASWTRTLLQFERINKNGALQNIILEKGIECSLEGYKKFLSGCYRPIAGYETIMQYLLFLFKGKGLTNWIILKYLEEWNYTDECIERKQLKIQKFEGLKINFKNIDDDYNIRFLHQMLAMRGADDNFFKKYKVMGDLSVNNYHELKLNEVNKDNLTFFAHPSENKLHLLSNLIKINTNIIGMEFNKRGHYSNKKNFFDVQKKLNLLHIIGSDSHEIISNLYDDIEFYKYDVNDLNKLILKYEQVIITGDSIENK